MKEEKHKWMHFKYPTGKQSARNNGDATDENPFLLLFFLLYKQFYYLTVGTFRKQNPAALPMSCTFHRGVGVLEVLATTTSRIT